MVLEGYPLATSAVDISVESVEGAKAKARSMSIIELSRPTINLILLKNNNGNLRRERLENLVLSERIRKTRGSMV